MSSIIIYNDFYMNLNFTKILVLETLVKFDIFMYKENYFNIYLQIYLFVKKSLVTLKL